MPVAMSLLAILDEGPTYGLNLRSEFEQRTGGVFPLNVGQVYTTLSRLERDGFVVSLEPKDGEVQKLYEITKTGRVKLREWFSCPTTAKAPGRDELVLKLVMAASRSEGGAGTVIQAERKNAVRTLQEYTLLKREAPRDAEIGWMFLLDSLVFQTEARVRWLDACEARLARASGDAAAGESRSPTKAPAASQRAGDEVRA